MLSFKHFFENSSFLYSWLTNHNEFIPIHSNENHDIACRKRGFKTIQDAFKAGWLRITYYGNAIMANNPFVIPTEIQKKELIDFAIENKISSVYFDNDEKFTMLYSIEDRF